MTTTRHEGEIRFPDHISLISTTDPASHITYANQHFCDVAGYSATEMEGEPHNLVRHPDMPKAAFADMWRRLQQGKSWMGLVKNRAKSGQFYWVNAYVTPILNDQQQIIEYQSVRTRPQDHDIAWAEQLYARIRDGKALPWLTRLTLEPGQLCLLLSGTALLGMGPVWSPASRGGASSPCSACWPRWGMAGICNGGWPDCWPWRARSRAAPFARYSMLGVRTAWPPLNCCCA